MRDHPAGSDAIAALRRTFPDLAGNDVRIVRAPGRVNLIGEHTDYNLGYVLPAAIDLEIRITHVRSGDRRVELERLDTGERGGFDLDDERPPDGTWLDYPAGVARELAAAGLPVSGIRGVVDSGLPMNAGLSSSAAIELASAWALLGEAADEVAPLALARMAQHAENEYIGVRCGLMDQFASACGQAEAALLLDCRSLDWRPVALPPDVRLVVCDSGSPRRLGSSAYNERRAECEAAARTLAAVEPGVTSLRDVTASMLAEHGDRLDPVALRRAEHVTAENERVIQVAEALAAGDLGTVGGALAESHASLRDRFDVGSAELDDLVDVASGVPGVLAARMTGAGFGGCTVNLVRPDAVEALRAAVMEEYPRRTGLAPRVLPVHAAVGAGRLSG